MKRSTRWAGLMLAAALLFALAAPGVLAAESTVSIRTAEDLEQLARDCTLDTWSRGKTVILENDLDLREKELAPIPTFSGTFLGSGHCITGVRISGSGNVRGLFRYIRSGAQVRDLTVEGTIHPSGRQDKLGLLAGSNAGQVSNCSAVGTVAGDNYVAGLIGVNEQGGQVVGGRFSGSVTGKHFVGGVAGANYGTLTRCDNSGSINTKDLEDDPKTDYMDLRQLNSMENVAVYTDIGGVVGLSDGTVQSCTNSGAVGSDQIGCNIGGVAGRSSGWLDGCTNTGTVNGKEDVGGIVGHLEPEVLKVYSDDFLGRLLARLEDLTDVMDRTAGHADGISDSVQAQVNDLSDKARDVKDIASDLTGAMTDWANGNIDQINELSARVSRVLDQMQGVMDDAAAMVADLDELVDDLERVRRDLVEAGKDGDKAGESLRQVADELQAADKALKAVLDDVNAAMDDLLDDLTGGADTDVILEDLRQLNQALSGMQGVLDRLDKALELGKTALDQLSDMGDDVRRALDDLGYVSDDADSLADNMDKVIRGLRDIIDEQADLPEIKLEPIGSDITDKSDRLDAAMDALLDSGDALNQLIGDSADTLIGDLRAINSQFRAITDLIRSEKNQREADQGKTAEELIRDHFQDDSATCDLEKQHDGRVSGSENRGRVLGNSAVGGIVGNIGIETDVDPDSDLTQVGDYSLEFNYKARALVSQCVNTGTAADKGDYAGGIVGRGYFGRVTQCQSYGGVTADGSYVGGIAGSLNGIADGSWAKCQMSGKDYVGGIAGYGKDLSGCRALVTLTGEAYVGAIAGDVDEDGAVSGNLFAGESLGGIDGISYAGKAEPADFDALCAEKGAPSGFSRLELTFRADGKVVAVVPFQYGRGIDSLPEIPAKKGCSAAWPQLDYTKLTTSQTLDAVYTPYRSALTDGGGELPQLLVDGSFSSRAQVSHATETVTWTDGKGNSHTGEGVTVTVDDPDLKEISYTVHWWLPEGGKQRYALWVKTADGWQQRDSSVDGSYLLFTTGERTVTFCIQERESSPVLPIALGCGGALAVILLGACLHKKRGGPLKKRLRRLRDARKAK